MMNILRTEIPDVLLLEPRVFEDGRGFFMETYQKQRFVDLGLDLEFVQDNHSRSVRGTLRGLHYQIVHPQGKLCRVVRGEVFDVAVDMRQGSPTFGSWVGARLNDENRWQMYVPPGFAHGFCVLSEIADFLYKCTDYYHPEHERTLLWNDPQVGIDWPLQQPMLSAKDQRGAGWGVADVFAAR